MECIPQETKTNRKHYGIYSYRNWKEFKYLWITMCTKDHSMQDWSGVISKFKTKLVFLGARWLNLIVLTILIKSILSIKFVGWVFVGPMVESTLCGIQNIWNCWNNAPVIIGWKLIKLLHFPTNHVSIIVNVYMVVNF